MSAVHPDVDGALVGAEVVAAGPLTLPSGRLVAAEPPGVFAPGEVAGWSYAETVPPGEYPVEVVRRDGDDFVADSSFGSDDPYVTYADDETGHDLVSFGLGGDGRFETWVGYTEAGEVACFLTDYADLAGPLS